METPIISIRLKPELDAYIERAVQGGRFKSRTEAITAALEQMFEGERDA